MRKIRTRKELPRLEVEITTRPVTAANRQAWQQFWERLLRDRAASVTNKDNGGEGSQTVRL